MRASPYVANGPAWTHAPSDSIVTSFSAVRDSSSRSWLTNTMVLLDSTMRRSSQRLPSRSRKLSGSSSSRMFASDRKSASSSRRLDSPPESCATERSATASYGWPSTIPQAAFQAASSA